MAIASLSLLPKYSGTTCVIEGPPPSNLVFGFKGKDLIHLFWNTNKFRCKDSFQVSGPLRGNPACTVEVSQSTDKDIFNYKTKQFCDDGFNFSGTSTAYFNYSSALCGQNISYQATTSFIGGSGSNVYFYKNLYWPFLSVGCASPISPAYFFYYAQTDGDGDEIGTATIILPGGSYSAPLRKFKNSSYNFIFEITSETASTELTAI